MLRVIFLVGKTSSGKGTLGARLATEFSLHHISLGETHRALNRQRRGPIPGMSEEINTCLTNGTEIPEAVLKAQFKPGNVPVVLQLHNRHVTNSKTPNLCGAILREQIAEVSSRVVVPRAILVDGLHTAFSHITSAEYRRVLQEFAPSYSGLTIHIQCPDDVVKARWLLRGRSADLSEGKFEQRMRRYNAFTPTFLMFLKSEGVVVETLNDETMSINEAYLTMLENLNNLPYWRSLVGIPG